jgi:hypothetical protein
MLGHVAGRRCRKPPLDGGDIGRASRLTPGAEGNPANADHLFSSLVVDVSPPRWRR